MYTYIHSSLHSLYVLLLWNAPCDILKKWSHVSTSSNGPCIMLIQTEPMHVACHHIMEINIPLTPLKSLLAIRLVVFVVTSKDAFTRKPWQIDLNKMNIYPHCEQSLLNYRKIIKLSFSLYNLYYSRQLYYKYCKSIYHRDQTASPREVRSIVFDTDRWEITTEKLYCWLLALAQLISTLCEIWTIEKARKWDWQPTGQQP